MSGSRRPDGALEDAVLRVLWNADEPLMPATVRDLLPMELAYTSVSTVLVRLVEKGLVGRNPIANSFGYFAQVDEATLVAQRMSAVLGQSSNHRRALAGFVSQLGKRDARLLKDLLESKDS
jgi:predicted transcriptional regulator